jgi:hypothetical protein
MRWKSVLKPSQSLAPFLKAKSNPIRKTLHVGQGQGERFLSLACWTVVQMSEEMCSVIYSRESWHGIRDSFQQKN